MSPPLPRTSIPAALGLCLLNWLVPGAGYIAVRDVPRGATLLVLTNAMLMIGIAGGGYVLAPAWSPKNPEFNVVAILTYLVESFHGGGWLALQALQKATAASPEAFFNLHRQSIRPFSDLGVFYLVVAGGLNYFATVRLYDLLAGAPELTESIHTTARQEGESA